MKRFVVIMVMLMMSCYGAWAQWAQNPIHDTNRVYDVVSESDTFYLFTLPKPCIFPHVYDWNPGDMLVQKYVITDTVTVYGVAIPLRNDFSQYPICDNIAYYKALLLNNLQPSGTYSYSMNLVDSVTLNRSHPRFCWFYYHDPCKEKPDLTAPCYEFYFDTPQQVNRMTGTFYVGRYNTGEPEWYMLKEFGGECYNSTMTSDIYYSMGPLDRFYTDPNYDKRWGVFFPIIGFRCGPIMHYQLDSYTGDSAVVSWHSVEEGTVYNIRLVGEDGSDTTFVTEDTTFTFTQLSDSVRYNVMLRKQCHYATSNYDTTVYGQWRSTLYFGNDTTDTTSRIIGRSEEGGIAVVPNPAKEEVTVSAGVGLQSIEAYNESGTRVYSGKCSSLTATLDVAAWPQGLYVLHISTAAGTTVKKLVVTR